MRTLDEVKELFPPTPAEEVQEGCGFYFLLQDGTLIGKSLRDGGHNHASMTDSGNGSYDTSKFCEDYEVVRFINSEDGIYIDVDRPPLTQVQCEAIRVVFNKVGIPTMTWRTFPNGKGKDNRGTLANFFVSIRKLRPGIDEWKNSPVVVRKK